MDIVPAKIFHVFSTSDRLIKLPFQQNLLQTILSVSNKCHSYPEKAAFFTHCTEEPADPEAEITYNFVLKPSCVFQTYGAVSEIKKRELTFQSVLLLWCARNSCTLS